jgi:hypothetical protein
VADFEVLVEGNQRIVRAVFRVPDENGVLTDPSTVVFTARRRREKGDDAADYAPTVYTFGIDPEVTKTVGVPTGSFDFKFTPTQGTWWVHVQGTGAATAAGEIGFVVDRAEALVA